VERPVSVTELWNRYESALLALTIWREARGEPMQCKLAVAYSVMNRVQRPSWWGRSLADVLGKKWQYSSLTAPGDPNLIKYPVRGDASFRECLEAADLAITQVAYNPAPGADSYHDISIDPPPWALKARFVVQLGRIRFYDVDRDYQDADAQ
jgi:spore germination cell wall hydrolase CwlJ-like protein